MKNFYFLLLVFFCFTAANSQIINFPDPNFKTKLLQSTAANNIGGGVAIDANGDGEIQISEAQVILGLDLKQANISDLTGIEYFTNLFALEFWDNNVSSINLQAQTQLVFLNCSDNSITDINSIGAPNLKQIWMQNNLITTVDWSNWPLLEEVFGEGNPLQSLEIINHTKLKIVSLMNCNITSLSLHNSPGLINVMVENNQISDVDVSGLPIIAQLKLDFNQIASIDLSQVPSMTQLIIDNNLLTTLNLSALTNLSYAGCNNNPMLQSIYAKNGAYETLGFNVGCPQLNYICTDQNQLAAVQSAITAAGVNAHTNSYCSFVPGGQFYTVQGNIKLDINGNGCDNGDIDNASLKFNITGPNGTESFISSEGSYVLSLQSGSYSIDLSTENPYFNISPPSINFELPTTENPLIQDICMTPNGQHSDLEVVVLPIGPAIPGFDAVYKIVYKNKGTTTLSGTVEFQYQEPLMDFVSTNTTFLAQSSGSIQYGYNDLQPFETREILLTLNVNSPTETPPVNIGNQLNLTAIINPIAGDEVENDNINGIKQVVVGSFDPNDKTCIEGDNVGPEMIGEYVHYMIRFENTGTYPAQNIVVKDMIDATKFDVSTLIPISGSHLFETRISETDKIEFIFENIQLPFDDATNDGYVAFKIKTLPSLVVGDTFSNFASIYFDYNFPIVTNTASTTIQQLGTSDFEFSEYFTLYPNPVQNTLNIKPNGSTQMKSASIYNTLGQLVLVITDASTISEIDVSDLKTGNYFIKISSDKGSANARFIKE